MDKRWIKIGKLVSLKRKPELAMVVDDILRTNKEVVGSEVGDTRKVSKVFTTGVLCHWIDAHNRYAKGTFHTTELQPYEVD